MNAYHGKCKSSLLLLAVAALAIAGCATPERTSKSDGPYIGMSLFDDFKHPATMMALDQGEAKRYTGNTPLRKKVGIGEVTYGFVPQVSLIGTTARMWELKLGHYREALRRSLATANLLAPDAGRAYLLHASVGEEKHDRPFVGKNTAYFTVQYRLVRVSDGKEALNTAIIGRHEYYEDLNGNDHGKRRYAVRHNIWQLVEQLNRLE